MNQIPKIIKVKCLEEFKLYNNWGKNLIADVKVGEYIAKLSEDTEEYFATDSEGREFLVAEIKDNVIKFEKEFKTL